MAPRHSLAYPRRPLYATLALGLAVAIGSYAAGNVLPPPAAGFALGSVDTAVAACSVMAESFYCADGDDNDCDGDVDCRDVDCSWDAACGGCPWWDFSCDFAVESSATGSRWIVDLGAKPPLQRFYIAGPQAVFIGLHPAR